MAKINDVASRAKVSKATVSRYINNKGFVSEKLQKRIDEAIKELNYKPDLIARSLRIRKSNSIGVIYPDIEDQFFSKIIQKIEEKAYRNNYTVILCNTQYSSDREKMYLEVLKRNLVDGYIIFTEFNNKDILEGLIKDEKVIFIDRSLKIKDEIFIKLDNIKSIKIAMNHLFELGHKKIGIIMGPMGVTTGIERYTGYKMALSENNIGINENLIKFAGSSLENVKRKAEELITSEIKPTSIIATNTATTVGLLLAVKKLKLKIPDDISIIGFDELSNHLLIDPPLTTIIQPLDRFGSLAINTLLKLLKNKKIKNKTIELEPKIIIRDSCMKNINRFFKNIQDISMNLLG